VTAKPLTCVNCKRPFPANGELAAIADGGKVAFDELRRRTWRICGECGTWNLLGAEATAAALPELLARYAAGTPEMNAGIGVVHLGSKLDLIRIDDGAVGAASDAAVTERRREIDQRTRVIVVAIVGLFILTFVGMVFKPSYLSPRWLIFIGMVGMASAGLAMFYEWRKLGRTPLPKGTMITGGVGVALQVVGLLLNDTFGGVGRRLVMLASIGAAAFLLNRIWGPAATILKLDLADGTRVPICRLDMVRATIAWEGEAISLHNLPGDRELSSADAVNVLRRFLDRFSSGANPTVTGAAHQLVRTTGGLSGLLRSLDGWREDHGGRIVIADLPPVYRVALDLALAQRAAGIDGHAEIREQADHAAIVAAEAEALE
jgi:hypothetical protein